MGKNSKTFCGLRKMSTFPGLCHADIVSWEEEMVKYAEVL